MTIGSRSTVSGPGAGPLPAGETRRKGRRMRLKAILMSGSSRRVCDRSLRRRARRGHQGSADAALVDVGRRGSRPERHQAGNGQAGFRLEGRPGRRRRRRRGHDHLESHGRRGQSPDRLPDSRLLRARLRRRGQARRHHPARDQRRLGQGYSDRAAEIHHRRRQVGRRSGQHPFRELDLGQQGARWRRSAARSPRPSTS